MTTTDDARHELEEPPRPARRQSVAVVGRPNVGKSALFNRMTGRRDAIVQEIPGVTRDRKTAEADWAGRRFEVVDTGGWTAGGGALERQVSAQAERALEQADVVLLVCDVTVGITDEDEAVARWLRRRDRRVVVVANKVDTASREGDAWELLALGLGAPVMVSALHGRGSGDLLDRVVAELDAAVQVRRGHLERDALGATRSEVPDATAAGSRRPSREPDTAVVVVGRPNVGKSTLFNRLVGDERSIVHDQPGTTRDSVDTVVETGEVSLRFIDTAGMRRAARVGSGTEYYAVLRALSAVDLADVALLVLDASEGITHQEQRLAERVDAAGCPIVVVLNKWDLLPADAREKVLTDVGDRLAFLAYAPVLKVSALTGKGIHSLVPAIDAAVDAYRHRVPTPELNRVVHEAQAAHPAPRGRVRYAVQAATDPPTFTLFASGTIPAPWIRYMERTIRESFGLGPSPIKVRVRRQGRP